MASFHRVFGHPHYGGNGAELTPIEFTLQHTDSKLVGAYRIFSGDNASNPKMLKRHMFGRAHLDLLGHRFLRTPRERAAQEVGPREQEHTPAPAQAA